MTYIAHIIDETRANSYFRKVLYTGEKSQLVIMSIVEGGEIGKEIHDHVEQTLFFLSGQGTAILNGEDHPITAGDVLVVSPSTEHNVINTGPEPLKFYTVYAPANHLDERIHETKEEADADVDDEAFGHSVR